MEFKNNPKRRIRISKTVKNVLYYGRGGLKEEEIKELKQYIEDIKEKDKVENDVLMKIGNILLRYGLSVRPIHNKEYDTTTIAFYNESKIKKSKLKT